MFFFSKPAVRVVRSAALMLFTSLLVHASAVTLTPTVTSIGGGLYKYAYSISYSGPDDAFLIDIGVPANPAAVTNLTVPTGFTSQFDSGLGLASFVEDTSSFTATPTSGFSFDSPDKPGSGTFTASLYDSNFDIFTISGSTLAPMTGTPEPSYLYLLGFFVPALFVLRRCLPGAIPFTRETNSRMEAQHVSNS